MNKKAKFLATASILAIFQIPGAYAHLEPKKGENMEKCYGVAKAGKNDCASKAEKHSCSGKSKTSNNPNEWIKVPKGLCDKLVGGNVVAAADAVKNKAEDHSKHNH